MCDLFGMSSNAEDRAWRSLAVLADEHSGKNPDGWGIAYYQNGRAKVEKAAERADTSRSFSPIIEKAKSKVIIAHIRHATAGSICNENCHPFKKDLLNRDWVFAHNGTLEKLSGHNSTKGTTDSEIAFGMLLEQAESYQNSGIIHGTFSGIQKGIKFVLDSCSADSTFNFLMSDGTIVYAFNHYPIKPIYYLKNEKDYGSAFLLSTQKLRGGNWKELPADRLLMVCFGEVLELSNRIPL